jgi:hypothetical protein
VSTDVVLGELIAQLEAAPQTPPPPPPRTTPPTTPRRRLQAADAADAGGATANEAAAAPSSVRLAFHLEPYPGRTAASTREDVADLMGRFRGSKALLRAGDGRPVYFVYDSYRWGLAGRMGGRVDGGMGRRV